MPQWKISMTVPARAVGAFEEMLEQLLVDQGMAVTARETGRDGPWLCEIYGGGEDETGDPDEGVLAAAIAEAATAAGIEMPSWGVEPLAEIDWAAENQRSFQPFQIGPFWIHPSHATQLAPQRSVPLRIDPGMAFGTGAHGTTRGCLEAIAALDPELCRNPVDLGCGSGILAIAMARLWGREVVAADNDPQAIETARENAALNAVDALLTFVVAEGFEDRLFAERGPFDLIVANILSGTLVGLAPAFARNATPHATLILSGLLDVQEDEVARACEAHGFRLDRSIAHEEWRTLVMTR